MKLTRLLALLLALLLCLSGCGTGAATTSETDNTASETTSESETEEEEETVEIPEEAFEDIVYYLTDGVYTANTVVGVVDDVEITAAEVLYWTAYQQYSMAYYYYYYYSYTISMDDTVNDDGTTLGEYLLQLGAETAMIYAVGVQKAKELGVEMSEENAAILATFYEDNVQTYGENRWEAYLSYGYIDEDDFDDESKAAWITEHGEEFYQHSLMYFACDADTYERLNSNMFILAALEEYVFEDTHSAYIVSEETLSAYAEENGTVWARCILLSVDTDSMDEEEIAEVLTQAEALCAQLSELSGDELAETFTELQSEYDESGTTAGSIYYYYSSDSLVDGFYDCAAALEIGEVGLSELTDYGYFILLREEETLEDLTDDYMSNTFDALLVQWANIYGVTVDISLLDMDSFYTNLENIQSAVITIDSLS